MHKLFVLACMVAVVSCSGGEPKAVEKPGSKADPEPEREMYVAPTDLSGPMDAPGKLPMSEVEAHMDGVLSVIKECADSSTYEGKVSVRVTILPTGEASAELTGEPSEPMIDECMMDAFDDTTFPTSERGQRFAYSYTF